jgi:DNA (cytosine-5)-methyltransferase 1
MDPLVLDFDTLGRPSVVDLFAGPGGMGEGFRQAGYFVIAAIDNDDHAYDTLVKNASPNGTTVLQRDISNVSLTGRVDVVVGGPPCQGFSMVGRPKISHLKKNGGKKRDRRNGLYKHFVRAVKSLNPQFFVMENVPGIFSYQEGKVARQISSDFEDMGYKTESRILNAVEYGVPQVRRRAFFVGNRVGVQNPFPNKTNFDPLRGAQATLDEPQNLAKCVTLSEAISDLPPLQPGGGLDEVAYPPPGRLTDYERAAREGSQMLYNHVARHHSDRDREVFRLLKEGQDMSDLPDLPKTMIPYRRDIFHDKIKKQSWGKPSSTILAHLQKDGLMYVHPAPDQARTFTPREAARLQSFPDQFRFCGPMTQQFRQIGNAVPPLLAQRLAMVIRPFLNPEDSPSVKCEPLRKKGKQSNVVEITRSHVTIQRSG